MKRSHIIFLVLTPPVMHNKGNFIISLGSFCKWLSQQAENLGVEIYPGFAASELIIEDNKLSGIITSDLGLEKDGRSRSKLSTWNRNSCKNTRFLQRVAEVI